MFLHEISKKNVPLQRKSAVNDSRYNIFDKSDYEQYIETASRHTRI